MTETIFLAPDIACGACARSIQKALAQTEGVARAVVDTDAKTVTVAHDPELVSVAAIQIRLDHIGFPTTIVGV